MDAKAEDPRMKANDYRVPVYDSQDWATMKSLDTNTIKELNSALVVKVDSKPITAKPKKSRARRSHHDRL